MNIKSVLLFEAIFVVIAFLVYSITGNPFFIFNFLYIGTALSIGIYLVSNNYRYGRNVIMLAIGSYLLIYVGIIGHEIYCWPVFGIICFWAFLKRQLFIFL